MTADFTAHRHPALAVACPACHACVGVWCKRPSEHKAANFHSARGRAADLTWLRQGAPFLETLDKSRGVIIREPRTEEERRRHAEAIAAAERELGERRAAA